MMNDPLEFAVAALCSAECPSTKRTGDEWTHTTVCTDARAELTTFRTRLAEAEQENEQHRKLEEFRRETHTQEDRADAAEEWIGVVSDELVAAGGQAGDRTVALANLRAALKQRTVLRAALAGILGVDTPEELDAMEATIRQSPAPASDKAVAIDAIDALRKTR